MVIVAQMGLLRAGREARRRRCADIVYKKGTVYFFTFLKK